MGVVIVVIVSQLLEGRRCRLSTGVEALQM